MKNTPGRKLGPRGAERRVRHARRFVLDWLAPHLDFEVRANTLMTLAIAHGKLVAARRGLVWPENVGGGGDGQHAE